MLDGIDALVALETFGTVSEAATRLRLTQSAVSKRVRALEARLGFPLVEPDGRKLRLTPRAVIFLDRARPLLAELRGLVKPGAADSTASFSLSLALADSIASSWGPSVVRRALSELPSVRVLLHAHRSVLVIESVRLGRYEVGLCTESLAAKDLVSHPLVSEPLVVLNSGFEPKFRRDEPLITIEEASATFRATEPLLRAHHPELLAGRLVFVESFAAVIQMVKAGFGNGIVPLGLALDLHVPRRSRRTLSRVERRIALLTRKSLHENPTFATFRDRLAAAAKQHFDERKKSAAHDDSLPRKARFE